MRMTHSPEYYLDKLANGSITKAEWQALQQLFAEQGNDAAFAAVLDGQLQQKAAHPGHYPQAVVNIQQGVAARIAQERTVPAKPMLRRRTLLAAAAVLLLVLGTTWLLLPHQAENDKPAVAKMPQVAPGTSGAVLTLANGAQILLDTIKNGRVALQGGTTVRVVNGALVYEGTGSNTIYNTISTPKGREYHITLPDGTGLWLNAASTVRYPVAFAAGERRIEVKGEAYMEVAADAHKPFYVVTPQAQIQVLGTVFNVNAYDGEAAEVTTLASGKIRVTGRTTLNGGLQPLTLQPGQAAHCNSTMLEARPGNVEKALAWKNGVFNFNEADIPAIMRQLARWYNVEVRYEGTLPTRTFEGEMGRTLRLDQVLRIFTKTGIHYEIDGNIVTIKP